MRKVLRQLQRVRGIVVQMEAPMARSVQHERLEQICRALAGMEQQGCLLSEDEEGGLWPFEDES
jgi:hypothetical protein